MTRILGIDPGSLVTGWGVIESDGAQVKRIASGVIRTAGVEFTERLRIICAGIGEVMCAHAPAEVAVERAFVQKNADSALKLGHARAAAICGTFAANVQVAEYAPRDVKQAVVGRGAAGKEQVEHMVRVLLSIKAPLQADEADALGVAICHAFKRGMQARIGVSLAETGRTRKGVRRR